MRDGDAAAQDVAYFCLDNLFRLLHPFMPFVTEELWSRTPGHREFLMRASWPDLQFVDPAAEETFGSVMRIVEEVRGHRQAAGAPPRGGALFLEPSTDRTVARLVARLAWVELVDDLADATPLGGAAGRVSFPKGAGDSRRQAELKRFPRRNRQEARRPRGRAACRNRPAELRVCLHSRSSRPSSYLSSRVG